MEMKILQQLVIKKLQILSTMAGWILEKKNLRLISKYDFLIHTSSYDANPSTVLEGISWGLIPVMTRQCGYENFSNHMYIPLNEIQKTIKKLKIYKI